MPAMISPASGGRPIRPVICPASHVMKRKSADHRTAHTPPCAAASQPPLSVLPPLILKAAAGAAEAAGSSRRLRVPVSRRQAHDRRRSIRARWFSPPQRLAARRFMRPEGSPFGYTDWPRFFRTKAAGDLRHASFDTNAAPERVATVHSLLRAALAEEHSSSAAAAGQQRVIMSGCTQPCSAPWERAQSCTSRVQLVAVRRACSLAVGLACSRYGAFAPLRTSRLSRQLAVCAMLCRGTAHRIPTHRKESSCRRLTRLLALAAATRDGVERA